MSVLSDNIEQFIKDMMSTCDEVLLQRNELAAYFSCVPSQINYVLMTRFTIDRGYIIMSKRGGGGYIRITRVDTDCLLHDLISTEIGDVLTQREAYGMIGRLIEEGTVSGREADILRAAVSGYALPTQEMQDNVRARVLRNMLQALLQ